MISEVVGPTGGIEEAARIKLIRFLGKDFPRSSVEKLLYSTTGFFILFNAISIPFALPKLRAFLGAPYLPSSTAAFRAVLEHVPELNRKNLKLLDVGSGDGRIIVEAARRGYSSMGIEVNPWLYIGSNLRARIGGHKTEVVLGNAWKCIPQIERFSPDVITFYGRPGGGVMHKFGKLAEDVSDKTGKELIIVSNKFTIPGWNIRLISHIEGFYVYRLHSNRI